MKYALFYFKDKPREKKTHIRSCSDYVSFVSSVPSSRRVYLVGSPYGRLQWQINVFQKPPTGELVSFWGKFFSCAFDRVLLPLLPQGAKKSQAVILQRSRNDRTVGGHAARKRKCRCVDDPSCCGPNRGISKRLPILPVDDISTGSSQIFVYFNGVQSGPPTVINSHNIRRFRVTKTSVNTPNFRNIPRSQLPQHPYSYSKYSYHESEGELNGYSSAPVSNKRTGYWLGIQGWRGQDWNTFHGTIDRRRVREDAFIKASKRAKDMNVNLAQAYAERKQTVNLLYSSINRLISVAIALRKGNVKHAESLLASKGRSSKKIALWDDNGNPVLVKKDGDWVTKNRVSRLMVPKERKTWIPPKDFANLWLEFQYGWRPLLSDIYGSCELIANTYHKKKLLEVSATSKFEISGVFSDAPGASLSGATWSNLGDYEDRIRARVKFFFREDDERIKVLSQTGIANPALLAWELLPYSFVVDWFVPVGDYISAIDSLFGVDFVKGTTTFVGERRIQTRWVQTHSGPASLSGSLVDLYKKEKDRVVYTTLPFPPAPVFEPKLGAERIASAISLLTQVITRGKTSVR